MSDVLASQCHGGGQLLKGFLSVKLFLIEVPIFLDFLWLLLAVQLRGSRSVIMFCQERKLA